jgi:hypothetical protein
MAKRHLKVSGDLGKVVFMVRWHTCWCRSWPLMWKIRSGTCETLPRLRRAFGIQTLSSIWLGGNTPQSTSREREQSWESTIDILSRNFSFEDVHVEGAQRIAEAVAKYDVDRFIHVSTYNADKNSPSKFYATKVGYSDYKDGIWLIPGVAGPRGGGCPLDLPRNHHRQTRSHVWLRGQVSPQIGGRVKLFCGQPHAGDDAACARKSGRFFLAPSLH